MPIAHRWATHCERSLRQDVVVLTEYDVHSEIAAYRAGGSQSFAEAMQSQGYRQVHAPYVRWEGHKRQRRMLAACMHCGVDTMCQAMQSSKGTGCVRD